MAGPILIVTFVFCLAIAAAAALIGHQLISTYDTNFHKHYFYYLVAFYAFAFYGLWGQVLLEALLASLETETAVIETVASFLPVLGVPFLFVSWLMLINMAYSMHGRAMRPTVLSLHALALVLVLLGAWLLITLLATGSSVSTENLRLFEAIGLIGVELAYFAAFGAIVSRSTTGARERKDRVLGVFALLLLSGFLARALVGGLVAFDVRFTAPALLAYFASNFPPLFYLRSRSDDAFEPVKAEDASSAGMEQIFDRYGITKRERQIVQKICLGKTNQQVADELFIGLQTVKDHTHRIYSKIGIKSRMQLVQLMNRQR